MRRILKILALITRDILSEVSYWFTINLRYMANIISIITPYIMYLLGQELAIQRGKFAVGGELFLPLVIALVVYYLRQIANRSNKGSAIPRPERRFTEVDDDGEVSIETDRTEELILYMADLEDWFERRHML